jgi:hypothetical protein
MAIDRLKRQKVVDFKTIYDGKSSKMVSGNVKLSSHYKRRILPVHSRLMCPTEVTTHPERAKLFNRLEPSLNQPRQLTNTV